MDVKTAKAQSGPTADKVHKWATIFSYLLIAVMTGVFFIHYSTFRQVIEDHSKIISKDPHYSSGSTCNLCHDFAHVHCADEAEVQDCFDCHEDDDVRPARLKYQSVLVLCTRCHPPNIFVSFTKEDGTRGEVDVSRAHPYGQRPTADTFPNTLPLNRKGKISCITCHDPHSTDRTTKTLRIYNPAAEGNPDDVRPLCMDCHHKNGIL